MAARLVRVFEVPMAFIAFIDGEREWFKSQVGLPEEIAEARYARARSRFARTPLRATSLSSWKISPATNVSPTTRC
jgi:hypothetical protein